MRAAQQQLSAIGLELSSGKCSTVSFDEGVPFLGSVVSAQSTARSRRAHRPLQTTVYIVNEGGLLRSKGNRIRLERDGETVLSLSVNRVRQIVLLGRTGLTTPLIHQLLQRGIDVVFLSSRGRFFGRLQTATAANPAVRRAQFQAIDDPDRRLEIARCLVRGKIANQRAGVLRAARRLDVQELQQVIRSLELDRQSAGEVRSLTMLLGVEGTASRRYFSVLPRLLADGWEFTGRRRRPPPDPVNALLSLGYTLLLHDAIAAAETVGLDPYQGFLHEAMPGRPSLALDLIEELRPLIVDSVVLRCLNTGILKPGDFEIDPGPPVSCRCTEEGLRRFLASYERRMLTVFSHPQTGRRVSYRVGLMLQARHLAEVCASDQLTYQPIVWK
jgi:CRISPR-associated protein Cas1